MGEMKNMRISSLSINRIAIHQIYKLNESADRYRLNEQLTSLEPRGLNVIKNRIITSIGEESKSLELIIQQANDDSVFQILNRMIYGDDNFFLEQSKTLAIKLANAQNSQNIPGGVIVIIQGKINEPEKNYIAIIKAESQEGFALDNSNPRALDLRYIAELLLTPYQKLYKIAIFIEKESELPFDGTLRDREDYLVRVYDQNMANSETQKAAKYFYKDFLGCDLMPSNRRLTKEFFLYTKDFINLSNFTDEEKFDLNSSLYDYLKVSRETIINVSDFASRYFSPEKSDEFLQFMRAKQFPLIAIHKDISLIKNSLRRRKLRFDTNISISGPSEGFNELVRILQSDDNSTTIRIQGKIKEQ